jgi:hypothetical protein
MRNVVAGIALGLAVSTGHAATLYTCPNGGGGDQLTRGFYVSNYPAATLDSVTLQYIGGPVGTYNITVTARLNAYDGPVVGTATQDVVIPGGGTAPATFNLGGTAIPAGSIVTFSQTVNSGPGTLFYDTGSGTCSNITETNGTTPPLDSFRRSTIGLTIAGTQGAPTVAQAVPALDARALGALALLVATAAAFALRRRRAPR